MMLLKKILPWALLGFIAFGLLNPNPFGNNPDIILDESYFLTSSLSAIQYHTLPGWDFPLSGTYYGGPQAYLDTAVMIPVVGVIVASQHFSPTAAKVWIALHTGTLLHILRLANGVCALIAIVFCFLLFRSRKIPAMLALTLMLFLFLLLSNALVFEFLHTAKMWGLYAILVALTSALFIAQEYYAAHLKEPFLSKNVYVALLVWSVVLVFFQSYFGVFTIGLITLYALILRHITVRDILNYLRTYWYLITGFALTQVSFLYQAWRIRRQLADASTRLPDGAIDWWARLTKPLVYTIESQPLSILYVIGILALLFLVIYKPSFFATKRRRLFIGIVTVHPILTYLIFQVVLGFDILPRYAIMLTIAVCFSVALLMSEFGRWAAIAALIASGLLFALVSMHGIALYWRPSSETVLLRTIDVNYNAPTDVFITDHSAVRMTLPVNYDSLSLLDQKRQDMSRFAFLLEHRDLLKADDSFKPLTLTAYLPDELAADIARFATTSDRVWVISSDCTDRCRLSEMDAGACFEINTNACGARPQEVNTLPVFLSADELGNPYVVRRVH